MSVSAFAKWKLEPYLPVAVLAQAGLATLLGLFTTYGSDGGHSALESDVRQRAAFFVDVSCMVFIGFGYLMTFMRKHGYTALVFTLVVSVLAVQWSILTLGFADTVYHGSWNSNIIVTMESLINGLFCAASVMIAFGAVIGKVSLPSMLVLAFFHVIVYSINFVVIMKYLKVVDIGGSLSIHLFGAYFGLAASAILSQRDVDAQRRHTVGVEATYTSDIFSMIGTVFLWISWPSFNGALAAQRYQLMAVINTLLSLCACAFTTAILSRLMRGDNKMHMVDMQNATLAGGVAMGCMADTPISPGGAVAVGMVAALVSTFGFNFLMPWLERKGLHDSCGVHNLHGMPGLLAGLVSMIAVGAYYQQGAYGAAFSATFAHGSRQAGIQLAGVVISLGFALVGGALAAGVARWLTRALSPAELMDDAASFHAPAEGYEPFEERSLLKAASASHL